MKVINFDAFLEVSPCWTRRPWVEEGTGHLLGWSACPALCTEQGCTAVAVKLQTSGMSLVVCTVGFRHPIFTLDGVRCFPHIYRAIFGKLGGSSRTGDSGSRSFPSSTTDCTKVSMQLVLCSTASALPFGSCHSAVEDWNCSAALCQAEVAALALKETLLKWLLSCAWPCAFI